MEYITYLLEKLPAQVCKEGARGIGDASTNCMGVMKYGDVAAHLRKLRLDPIQRLIRPILTKFMQHSRNVGGIFNHPVDTRNPSLANYLSKIERPIDLGTIRGRLQKGEFETVDKVQRHATSI